MVVCICDELHFFPKSVSTNYELRSGIRVKRYGRPNMHGRSISTFEGDDILWASIGRTSRNLARRNSPESSMLNFERRDRLLSLFGDPEEKLWQFVFAMGFIFIQRSSQKL